MAIFGNIEFDKIVQVGERVRLEGSGSFVSKDETAVTLVRMRADSTEPWITVSGASTTIEDWYIDWIYTTAGSFQPEIEITTSGLPVAFSNTITVVTKLADNLFSTDEELKAYEPDILKWLPMGKSTYNNIHRRVQEMILTELYKNRIINSDTTKITKDQIVDITEVREWSVFKTLNLIYSGISNKPDDVFATKSTMYLKQSAEYKNLVFNIIGIDLNKDSVISAGEKLDIRSGTLIRR
jgi:hypothetical protein